MSRHYHLPPQVNDKYGQPRRAGFEFEFGNLPIVDTAKALHVDQYAPFALRLCENPRRDIIRLSR